MVGAESQDAGGGPEAGARSRAHESKLSEADRLTQALERQNQRVADNLDGAERNLQQIEFQAGQSANGVESRPQQDRSAQHEVQDDRERDSGHSESRVDWTWSVNLWLASFVFMLCCLFGWALWRQQSFMAEQDKHLGWLLDKANRAECLNGIKPADDPQCLQYF